MHYSPIQLRLLNAAGRRIDAVWAVAPSEPGNNACHVSLPVASRHPHQPELAWNGFGWELRNLAADACLFVNDQALPPHQQQLIQIGDTLEIGLCRFLLEAADESLRANLPPVELAGNEASPELDPFSAQTLAAIGLPELGEVTTTEDIFDMVPSAPIADIPELPSSVAVADMPSASPVIELSDIRSEDDSAWAEITRLTSAYFEALADPDASLAMATSRANAVHDLPVLPPDDQDLTMEELTSGRLDIDTIAARFDKVGTSHLFATEPDEDVLWLFAPEGDTQPAQRRPPQRSRQEHHVLALDSTYLPSTRPAKERSAQANPGEEQKS